MNAAMNLQNITSIIAIMPLLCALVGTEVGPKSGWMHLISGITRTSKDVISKLIQLSLYK